MPKKIFKLPLTFKDYFRIPRLIYGSAGLNFIEQPKQKWIRNFFYTLAFCCLCSHIFSRSYMIRQLVTSIRMLDLATSTKIGAYLTFALDTNVKCLAFLFSFRRIRKLYNTLERIYPKSLKQFRKHDVHNFYIPYRIRVAIVCYFGAIWFLILSPICISTGTYLRDSFWSNQEGEEGDRQGDLQGEDGISDVAVSGFSYNKPIPMEYNFDYRKPALYTLIYVVETFNIHITTVMSMGTDVWLLCFLSQICMQLSYVGRMLQEYEPNETTNREDCEFLNRVIRRHQLLLGLYKDIDKTFGMSLVINVLTTMCVLCICAVVMTIDGVGIEFIKICNFFICYIIQFYFVCSYGQKLKNLSENISLCAYKAKWYNGSTVFKKRLQFIILRSQKPMVLSAYGFHPIGLETFKIVMTMSYRVFTLLQTMIRE